MANWHTWSSYNMNSLSHHPALFLFALLTLQPPLCCLSQPLLSSPPLGMRVEVDKLRLGSTPPSCHNKCNQCSPCTAVQVPTLPAPGKAHPSFSNQYSSNYKPLGWKCCCGDRLYNP